MKQKIISQWDQARRARNALFEAHMMCFRANNYTEARKLWELYLEADKVCDALFEIEFK